MSSSHFDRISAGYDESLPAHVVEHYLRKRTSFVIEHCPRGRGLDVGCGTGALAARIAEAGWDMVGVDPSEGMLDVLRKRAPQVEALVASGSSLPLEDGSFDLVLSIAVMHHIAEPAEVRRTLAEMVRVAKPSGRIVVWDHNARNPYWRLLMRRVPQDTGDERIIPEPELVRGLRDAGAEILLSEQLGFVPDFVPPTLLRAAAAAERAAERTPLVRRLCAHNVILARPRTPSR
jgi:SAM-dependent methyltransferase